MLIRILETLVKKVKPVPPSAKENLTASTPEDLKKSLGIHPFGSKFLIERKDIIALQNFYLNTNAIPMPKALHEHFNKQHDLLRSILGLVSLEEKEKLTLEVSPSSEGFLSKQYICTCYNKKNKK